jgi:hypothetical protein
MKNQPSLLQNRYQIPPGPAVQTGSNSDSYAPVHSVGIPGFGI